MAEIMNVTANALRAMTTMASPTKEASSVSKTVTKKKVTAEQTKKQERVSEDNIERDIVAVSKDGDTVAVSKESVVDVQKTSEQMDNENREREMDTEKRPIEMIEAPEIQPIEALEIDVVPTTFTGISDQRVEQMYQDGMISRYDYDKEMTARETAREARIEAVEYYQDDAAKTRTELGRVEREDIMLERAFDDEDTGYTPEIRADVVDSLQQKSAESTRRNEEDQRLWDYQFLA